MQLLLNRVAHFDDATIGVLHVDGRPMCFTLEDEFREEKVKKETRIPSGKYQITQRKVLSGLTKKYQNRYEWFTWHLMLNDVPGFQYIYLHIGTNDDHTDGCILVGRGAMIGESIQWINNSKDAFHSLYCDVTSALDAGDEVWIEIVD